MTEQHEYIFLIKVKVKLSLCFNWAPCHTGVLGNGVIAPRIIDLGIRWRRMVSFTRRPRYPQEKSPWNLLDRRLGGPRSQSGHGGEEENTQHMPGLEAPIIKPVMDSFKQFWLLWETNVWNAEQHLYRIHWFRTCSYEGVSKSLRTGRLERELQIVQLSATRYSLFTICESV
jgi:hypothetical protein